LIFHHHLWVGWHFYFTGEKVRHSKFRSSRQWVLTTHPSVAQNSLAPLQLGRPVWPAAANGLRAEVTSGTRGWGKKKKKKKPPVYPLSSSFSCPPKPRGCTLRYQRGSTVWNSQMPKPLPEGSCLIHRGLCKAKQSKSSAWWALRSGRRVYCPA
jgi:hypothetical protein